MTLARGSTPAPAAGAVCTRPEVVDDDPAFRLLWHKGILDQDEAELADEEFERFVVVAHDQRHKCQRLLHGSGGESRPPSSVTRPPANRFGGQYNYARNETPNRPPRDVQAEPDLRLDFVCL